MIGALSCPGTSGVALWSMAVSRDEVAWVLYQDGRLFKASTADASCQATSYTTQSSSFTRFGMGFALEGPGSTHEALYVASSVGAGLAKIDPTTFALTPVGAFGGLSTTDAELTGSGDGRLFGLFTQTKPVTLGAIDQATANVSSAYQFPGLDLGVGWAMASWGGRFWIFTAPNGVSSDVLRFDPSAQKAETAASNLGFVVVGAGVSTCAPIGP